jgi:hypothetical protein
MAHDGMKISVLYRYDINGAWTHDIDIKMGEHESDPNSMWRVVEIIDPDELRQTIHSLEEECENLTEQNRLLTNRISELNNKT